MFMYHKKYSQIEIIFHVRKSECSYLYLYSLNKLFTHFNIYVHAILLRTLGDMETQESITYSSHVDSRIRSSLYPKIITTITRTQQNSSSIEFVWLHHRKSQVCDLFPMKFSLYYSKEKSWMTYWFLSSKTHVQVIRKKNPWSTRSTLFFHWCVRSWN